MDTLRYSANSTKGFKIIMELVHDQIDYLEVCQYLVKKSKYGMPEMLDYLLQNQQVDCKSLFSLLIHSESKYIPFVQQIGKILLKYIPRPPPVRLMEEAEERKNAMLARLLAEHKAD